jgi:hypothetical protein
MKGSTSQAIAPNTHGMREPIEFSIGLHNCPKHSCLRVSFRPIMETGVVSTGVPSRLGLGRNLPVCHAEIEHVAELANEEQSDG